MKTDPKTSETVSRISFDAAASVAADRLHEIVSLQETNAVLLAALEGITKAVAGISVYNHDMEALVEAARAAIHKARNGSILIAGVASDNQSDSPTVRA